MSAEAIPVRSFDYITKGPVGQAVVRLAWPVVLAEALHTLFHIVDIAWVGRLGAWATAAIASSMFALWTVFAVANLVATGLTAQVSRSLGAGDRERAGHANAQAMLFAFGLGCIVALLCWLLAGRLFVALGATPAVARAGGRFLTIYGAGAPFSFLYTTSSAAMRASGDTRTPMIITASALAANAALDPLLIYGWGPFPRWEVAGAACATVLCQTAAAAAFLTLASRRHPAFPLEPRSLLRLDARVIGLQARIGAPYCLVGTLFSLNYLLFSAVAARFGDAALAVIGISNRLESITYLAADGFAVAAATLVGQNLGASRPERAERGAWLATATVSAAAAGLTLILLLFPRELFRIFTPDPAVIGLGAGYLRILALCQVATAVEGVLGGVFAGAGDTVPPMTIHLLFGAARPGLAYALAVGLGLGLTGIALTISITCILRAALLLAIFLRGGWKRHRLPGWIPPPLPAEDAPDLTT